MSFRPALAALAFVFVAAIGARSADAGRHPLFPRFDDRGTLEWYVDLADAQAAAEAQGKLIFLESGRLECPNCIHVVSELIPSPALRARFAAVAVGLAVDCDSDRPDPRVEGLLSGGLPDARMLPLCGFATANLRWVTGFSGYASESDVERQLTIAEQRLQYWKERRAAASRPCEPPRPVVAAAPPAVRPVATPPVAPAPERAPAPEKALAAAPAPMPTPAPAQAQAPRPAPTPMTVPAPRASPPAITAAPAPTPARSTPVAPAPEKALAAAPPPPVTPPAPARPPLTIAPDPAPIPRPILAMPPPVAPTPKPPPAIAAAPKPPPGPSPAAGAPPAGSRAVLVGPPKRTAALPPPTRIGEPARGPVAPGSPSGGLVRKAREAAANARWGEVLRLQEAGVGLPRDAEAIELENLGARARTWSVETLQTAAEHASHDRFEQALVGLASVRLEMAGRVQEIDAERGERAVERLSTIVRGDPDVAIDCALEARKAYAEFRGTRWASLFRSHLVAPSCPSSSVAH